LLALRFDLSIEEAAAASSYESAQMFYNPVFDEKNDQRLLSVLEDFLREEICFPRSHGQGFYNKVLECMMRRAEIID
jgi:Chromosome segregation protein Csm1/Pcs1